MVWNKFELINQFIDKIMELLKEEALSHKFDLTQFIMNIKSISDL